jgi:hypothetical protein
MQASHSEVLSDSQDNQCEMCDKLGLPQAFHKVIQ